MRPMLALASSIAIAVGAFTARAGDAPSAPDVPPAVKAGLEKVAPGAVVRKVEVEQEDGKTAYEFLIVVGGKTEEITLALDGTLLSREAEEAGDEGDEGEEAPVDEKAVPAPVRAAAATVLGATPATRYTKEAKDGVEIYEVEFVRAGHKASAAFTAAGELLEVEVAADVASLPEAVRKRLEAVAPGAKIDHADSVRRVYYEVKVKLADGTVREFKVDAAGQVLEADPEEAAEHEAPGAQK